VSARGTAVAALLALLALAPAASAHVTVAPDRVAPGSVVELAIRVPNERDVPTTKVAVQIPAGLEVFSFSEVPGWTREATEAADGTLESVTWTGSLSAGSYVSFDLLGSTPDQPGELVFKAVQTYEGGEEVAWIGEPDSDEPAPVVEVTADAASGGAADDGHDDEAATTGADTAAANTAEAPATSAAEPTTVPEAGTSAPAATEVAAPSVGVAEEDDDTPAATWVALALGAAGLVAGVAALVVALRRRPDGGPPGGTDSY
jgi:uncharacterized protein YcnI